MASTLQQLAEGLAERLQRSVAIDNARLQLLAHSPHRGEVDAARAESILRRSVPRETVEHVYACRDESSGLYIVTPRSDLGLEDTRIGVPILHDGTLLGFVWMLQSEGLADAEHIGAAEAAAREAALLINREYLQAGLDHGRERDLVERLLADDGDPDASAEELIREGLFVAGPYAVIVAEIERTGERLTGQDELALAAGLAAIRSRRLPHDILTLERRDHVVLIVAEPLGESGRDALIALGTSLRDLILAKTDAVHCWIGMGRTRDRLADARRSYDEALLTTRICRRVRILDPVTPVERLGVYEMLGHVSDDALRAMVHPGLRDLMSQGSRTESLVHTLEVYLDNAGDVKAASELLFAHRTSLYYRLRRVQELTGLDLSNGDDRLIAHLGLKIGRLLADDVA